MFAIANLEQGVLFGGVLAKAGAGDNRNHGGGTDWQAALAALLCPSARPAARRIVRGFATLLIGGLVLFIGTHPLLDFTGPARPKADALDAFADLLGTEPV
ncbi:MAG TPA: hypothetical protein VFZ03_17175 [Dongiaceae bacterium]